MIKNLDKDNLISDLNKLIIDKKTQTKKIDIAENYITDLLSKLENDSGLLKNNSIEIIDIFSAILNIAFDKNNKIERDRQKSDVQNTLRNIFNKTKKI